MFALVCIKATQDVASRFLLQLQYTDNHVNESLQMHFKVAVRTFMLLMQAGDSLTDDLSVVGVLWLYDELDYYILGWLMQL